MADIVSTVAMAAGVSWASGLRLYLVLFTIGALGKLGMTALPAQLQLLENPWVLVATGSMLTLEFFADKIPALDSMWDALHTFIRIPAGALLAAATVLPIGREWALVAAILGGTLTAGSHFTKAGSRALINTSPEPFSNWAASFSEDFIAITGLWAALFAPILFLIGLAIVMLLTAWLLPKIWRGIRMVLRRVTNHAQGSMPIS